MCGIILTTWVYLFLFCKFKNYEPNFLSNFKIIQMIHFILDNLWLCFSSSLSISSKMSNVCAYYSLIILLISSGSTVIHLIHSWHWQFMSPLFFFVSPGTDLSILFISFLNDFIFCFSVLNFNNFCSYFLRLVYLCLLFFLGCRGRCLHYKFET